MPGPMVPRWGYPYGVLPQRTTGHSSLTATIHFSMPDMDADKKIGEMVRRKHHVKKVLLTI